MAPRTKAAPGTVRSHREVKCWCGHLIREGDEPDNCGHVLWDNVEGFYEKLSMELLSFVRAQAEGRAREWVREKFDDSLAPYEMTAGEVAENLVYRISAGFCSGIYRCPKCRRVHVHVRGTENQWESFVPEGRVAGR